MKEWLDNVRMSEATPAPPKREAKSPPWHSKKAAGALGGLTGASAAVVWLPAGASEWGVLAALLIGSLPGLLLIASETFLDWQAMVLRQPRADPFEAPAE